MIHIGLTDDQKDVEIAHYVADHGIRKVVVFSPEKFRPEFTAMCDHVEYAEIIMYRTYYRLLQEIDESTLLVINECMRTQNRHDLTYNCLRNFLNQTSHQLVFQYLPLIDTFNDFMILFDFDTRSRWKRDPWNTALREEFRVEASDVSIAMNRISVVTDADTKERYECEKRLLIDGIGLSDPHTIPRNLYLLSGRAKIGSMDPNRNYIGRNNRFKLPNFQTYREPPFAPDACVFEFCHRFIDFADFLSLSRQTEIDVIVADLKVDQWYWQRYQDWLKRIQDAQTILRG